MPPINLRRIFRTYRHVRRRAHAQRASSEAPKGSTSRRSHNPLSRLVVLQPSTVSPLRPPLSAIPSPLLTPRSRTDPPTCSSSTDILTWRTLLTSALTQFLGITGSAIQIDILHLAGDEAWLRVPRCSAKRFQAAVGGFIGASDGRSVGFRTKASGEFLMGVVSKRAEEELWG